MNPDAPSGFRLSQDQVRFVELAIKEAILEDVEERLSAIEAGREAALAERFAKVDGLIAASSAPPRAEGPSPALIAGGLAGAVAISAILVFALVPGRVVRALDRSGAEVEAIGAQVAEARAEVEAGAATVDSLTLLIQQRAEELELGARSTALRGDIVAILKDDPEFIRAARGPVGPGGPAGAPPEGVRYAPGVAYFESQGTAVASLGLAAGGGGHVQIHNPSGGRVGYVGASGQGNGLLRVNDRTDRSAVAIAAGSDSSAVTLRNGSALAYLATPTANTAQLTVANRSGDGGVTLRSRGGLGGILVNGRTVHDLAEVFELADRRGVRPGVVLSVVNERGELGPSTGPYDRRVVGVVSGAGGYVAGLVLGSRADGSSDLPVAINGQVFVRVNLEGGALTPGDLLVASPEPGVAMKGVDRARLTGAVIGKALEPFDEADPDGLVKILVMTR